MTRGRAPHTDPIEQKPVGFRADSRYHDAMPDMHENGIGKDYPGYRMFYTARTGAIDYINKEYSERPALPSEANRFKRDLASAAETDASIAAYIRKHPDLGTLEPEPLFEDLMRASKQSLD